MKWFKAANIDEIPKGESKLIDINNEKIALFNVDNEFFALKHECPHEGGPLAEGELVDNCIVCPWHGWMFDVKTGKCPDREAGTDTYEVKVEENEVFIRM